jgi:phenylalanyl-tRNA synthetase alpha chain
MQDTFFVKNPNGTGEDYVLRTHTSSVQVHTMQNEKPPIRIIAPGRVFRNEAVSARSHCIFHQIEGLYIDEGVTFADMKQTLEYFAKEFFGKSKIRLRPSYFPFTEPSAEMDVYWGLENELDYRITKGTGWLWHRFRKIQRFCFWYGLRKKCYAAFSNSRYPHDFRK